jgi:hypothetical protein
MEEDLTLDLDIIMIPQTVDFDITMTPQAIEIEVIIP